MKSKVKYIGENIHIAPRTIIGTNVSIGHGSCIGYSNSTQDVITIHDNVKIGAFCVVESGVVIGDKCVIDHHSVIYSNVIIGVNCKILYSSKIFSDSRIGKNCIIGGDVPERTIIEDNVTMMGVIAHSYRDATLDWESTDEPSPIIKKGSVVGCNATIIGGITIGEGAYISSGEIVKFDVPPMSLINKGKIIPLKELRGFVNSRL